MNTKTEKINIAENSTNGHFVEKSKNVIELDKKDGIYFVEGPGILTTENHTTLEMKDDCLITPQKVYDPFKGKYTRVID